MDIQALALQAGFEPYETYHLSGSGESDRICSVGEYPCGDTVREFARLVLEEAAKMLDFAADGLDGTGEADAVALVLDCADMVRALKP